MPPLTAVKWSSESTSIAFAWDGTSVQTIDFNRQVATQLINQVDSVDVINNTIWFTSTTGGQTTLWRQSTFGQSAPRFVTMFDGPVEFLPAGNNHPVVRQSPSGLTTIVRIDNISNQAVLQDLGQVDDWWWSSQTQPIWTRGVDLWTLDKKNQPVLVERSVADVTWGDWAVPEKVIALSDKTSLRIRQFEPTLGSPLLLNYALPDTAKLVSSWVDTKLNAYLVTDPAPAILLVSWSPTADL